MPPREILAEVIRQLLHNISVPVPDSELMQEPDVPYGSLPVTIAASSHELEPVLRIVLEELY